MSSLRWMLVLAAILVGLLVFVIKSGMMIEQGESSSPEVTYRQHATSTYSQIKKQVGNIEETRQQQTNFSQ